ncbi:hypothetical protein DFH70_004834 [Clostridium beijerinckii]|nr:hypothetical protein [Clostridium beijerinckii]NRW25708.1 hypothetical protein [Clostridium beijerinckii]NRW44827.1 hypothetical protein [Clostridium beijerinckii]NRY64825.1 hypothetical protein [Clostridium beijerinckii]NSA89444.1 hypothetical protein [Clostridium beijerinckii]
MGLTFESTKNSSMTDIFTIEKKNINTLLHLLVILTLEKVLYSIP